MAQINIRIDDKLKDEAEKLFDELGLNMSSAFNVFLKQSIRQGGIPFEITTRTDPFYSESNINVLNRLLNDANIGKLTEHDLIED